MPVIRAFLLKKSPRPMKLLRWAPTIRQQYGKGTRSDGAVSSQSRDSGALVGNLCALPDKIVNRRGRPILGDRPDQDIERLVAIEHLQRRLQLVEQRAQLHPRQVMLESAQDHRMLGARDVLANQQF